MKKLNRRLLLLSILIYSITLILFNCFVVKTDFLLDKKLKDFSEISFTGKQIDFDFLLKYQSIVVIAEYTDGHRGVYDPMGKLDSFYLTYDKEKYKERYFNYNDYALKSNKYIYYTNNLGFSDINMIKKISQFEAEYKVYNLFYYNKPIQKITIFGQDMNKVKKELINYGLIQNDKSYYSPLYLISLHDYSGLFEKAMQLILIVSIIFSTIVYGIEFFYARRKIKIHILNGITMAVFLKKYFVSYLIFFIIIVLGINVVLNYFDYLLFMNHKLLFETALIFIVFYSVLYLLFTVYTFYKMEDKYEIH